MKGEKKKKRKRKRRRREGEKFKQSKRYGTLDFWMELLNLSKDLMVY